MRIKIITIILLAFLYINLSLAKGGENNSPSIELIKLLNIENIMVNTSILTFAPFLETIRTKGMVEEGVQEVKGVSDVYFRKIASDPDFKKELTHIYEKKFTTNELKELVEFYKSPIGQKSLQLLPEMFNAGSKLGEKYANKHASGFKEQLTLIMKKYAKK